MRYVASMLILSLLACGPSFSSFLDRYPETRCAYQVRCAGADPADVEACVEELDDAVGGLDEWEGYTPADGAACLDGLDGDACADSLETAEACLFAVSGG